MSVAILIVCACCLFALLAVIAEVQCALELLRANAYELQCALELLSVQKRASGYRRTRRLTGRFGDRA